LSTATESNSEGDVKIEVKGLDKLARDLDEIQRALATLDGTIGTLKFNTHDRQDVERAIRQMEHEIDVKVGAYRSNAMVEKIAMQAKQHFRQPIRERAEAARKAQPR
jgi:hypothetical protein